ncbi:hypothetical protein [Bdellovibrio bacteriovorus]|uniref:hypothetical protein n=1 Tax=Bdellovibrio bacteriovorus TaxID=959 RepID=UPI0035A70480
MFTTKYVPKPCEKAGKEKQKFTGHVVLRVPSSTEKLVMLEQIGVEFEENGEMKPLQTTKLSTLKKMVEASKDFFQEVNIKRLEDGKEFKSFDELNYDDSCLAILTDVAAQMFNGGIKISKN